MADVIKNNSILTRLDLSLNSIGNEGIKGAHTCPLLPRSWVLAKEPNDSKEIRLRCICDNDIFR